MPGAVRLPGGIGGGARTPRFQQPLPRNGPCAGASSGGAAVAPGHSALLHRFAVTRHVDVVVGLLSSHFSAWNSQGMSPPPRRQAGRGRRRPSHALWGRPLGWHLWSLQYPGPRARFLPGLCYLGPHGLAWGAGSEVPPPWLCPKVPGPPCVRRPHSAALGFYLVLYPHTQLTYFQILPGADFFPTGAAGTKAATG